MAPGKPFPIEFSELNHIDPDSKLRTPAGSIRYWVDLVPTEETYHEFDVGATRKGADFEIRVTVWNVKGVTIYQDDGQRNDLIVRGTLIIRSIDGSVTRHTKETDCHKFCNQDGTFNWRWKWPVVCPAASCSLVLQLMDSDALTDAEPLYDPEVVPLDHHLRLAYTNYIHHKNIENAVMGNHRTYVLFDSWPAGKMKCSIFFIFLINQNLVEVELMVMMFSCGAAPFLLSMCMLSGPILALLAIVRFSRFCYQ